MCQFQAHARTLQLRQVIRFEDTLLIYSDRKRIKQILTNLIINAVKFTYSGSVTVSAMILNNKKNSEEAKTNSLEDAPLIFEYSSDSDQSPGSSSLLDLNGNGDIPYIHHKI